MFASRLPFSKIMLQKSQKHQKITNLWNRIRQFFNNKDWRNMSVKDLTHLFFLCKKELAILDFNMVHLYLPFFVSSLERLVWCCGHTGQAQIFEDIFIRVVVLLNHLRCYHWMLENGRSLDGASYFKSFDKKEYFHTKRDTKQIFLKYAKDQMSDLIWEIRNPKLANKDKNRKNELTRAEEQKLVMLICCRGEIIISFRKMLTC